MTDTRIEPRAGSGASLDVAFLRIQTHGDSALACEVLHMFAEQARRLVPSLPELAADEQTATAHLLKGSCQAIGAAAAVDLLQRYDVADTAGRKQLYPDLAAAFAELEADITVHLAAP